MTESKTVVKIASFDHIPGIIAVLEKNLMANQPKDSALENQGFLMHGFTAEDVRAAILDKENHLVLVVLRESDVVGYAMGYNIKTQPVLQERLFNSARTVSPAEKTFYHRHIATRPDGKGAGKQLLQRILEETAQQGYQHVICQIAEKPVKNNISIAFHEKFGFQLCGFLPPDDKGAIYGAYLKSL